MEKKKVFCWMAKSRFYPETPVRFSRYFATRELCERNKPHETESAKYHHAAGWEIVSESLSIPAWSIVRA